MSNTASLKQRLRAGDTLVSLRIPIEISRASLEIALTKGTYDLLYIDGQHTAFSEAQLVSFCAMAEELALPVQFRIPHTRHTYLIGRYLDFGPAAILVPEVADEATVDEAIAYSYYPPVGRRSVGGMARLGMRTGQWDRRSYASWWNETMVLAIQFESVEAIINARQLAKPGVDMIAFGPNDLQFSLEAHPEFPLKDVDACMRHVAEQLKGSNVRLGMAVPTEPEEREKYLEMGITSFQELARP
jgi:2-keto-3-deoxy-L-rhamnonate aldolase RhmA